MHTSRKFGKRDTIPSPESPDSCPLVFDHIENSILGYSFCVDRRNGASLLRLVDDRQVESNGVVMSKRSSSKGQIRQATGYPV